MWRGKKKIIFSRFPGDHPHPRAGSKCRTPWEARSPSQAAFRPAPLRFLLLYSVVFFCRSHQWLNSSGLFHCSLVYCQWPGDRIAPPNPTPWVLKRLPIWFTSAFPGPERRQIFAVLGIHVLSEYRMCQRLSQICTCPLAQQTDL